MRKLTVLSAILGFLSMLTFQAQASAIPDCSSDAIFSFGRRYDYSLFSTTGIALGVIFVIAAGCCTWFYIRRIDRRSDAEVADMIDTITRATDFIKETKEAVKEKEEIVSRMTSAGTELLQKIIDYGIRYSDDMEKLSENLRALAKDQRHNDIHIRDNMKILHRQADVFQRLFDTAFLSTYPCFVERLNSLLLPEKTFPVPADGQLTPELRVTAFMRIGVDDCNRIARILRLSLNTVYTYRNRTRQRAADRDTFMASLMKIN